MSVNSAIIIDIKSKQFLVNGEKFYLECDRINSKEGELVSFPIVGAMNDYRAKGSVSFLVKRHFLGKKRVVFHKTKRNGDKHFGGRGGTRPRLTELHVDKIDLISDSK